MAVFVYTQQNIRQAMGVIMIPWLSCFSRGSHKQEICNMVNTIQTGTHRIAPMISDKTRQEQQADLQWEKNK